MIAPRLETERLVLRGFCVADVEPMAAFFADEDATRFIGGTEPHYRAASIVSSFVGHWQLYGQGQWAVEDKASGKLAGFLGYINPPDWPEPEIGWTIFPAYQGRGYAPEGARVARAEIARLGGPNRLVSYIDPANQPSVRVAEKLGAVRERKIGLRDMKVFVWRHPAVEKEAA
jgi:RimJ/RimL family protein N-acetyltransferase